MAADENEVGTLVHESATASGSIRIRLDIAYDGTDFRGWTRQPGLRTVQGELEAALATVFSRDGAAPTLTVAGRTDAGVHALGQVAHLDLTPAQAAGFRRARNGGGPGELSRRLNGIAGLDSDIVVTASSLAPEGFDARFSAVWRRYEYRIADSGALRNPLTRRSTLWYPRELDASLMAEAAKSMLGLHDWSSFCKARDGATSVRTLQEFTWSRAADGTLGALPGHFQRLAAGSGGCPSSGFSASGTTGSARASSRSSRRRGSRCSRSATRMGRTSRPGQSRPAQDETRSSSAGDGGL